MIEISFYYKSLFKLVVLHNYYAEQPSNDFRLVPTADSQKMAKKLGLILKAADGENILLYEEDKIEGLLAEVEKKPLIKFTYLLYSSNPYFINFTDQPIESRSEIFYFSNNTVNRSEESNILHKSDHAGKADRFTLLKELKVSGDGQEKLIELKDDQGQVIFKKNIGAEEKLIITNQLVPIGKYHFHENGKHQSTFVLFTEVPVLRPIAIVDISLSGAIKEEFINGVKENEIPFYSYKISFSARSTFWKYFLISKYNSNLKNTTIDSGESEFKFKGPEQVKMKNGQDAVMFVSNSPLPLRQIQDLRFQLKNVRMGIVNGKTIMDRLPSPSPETIKPDSRDENSKVYSEIIIHI